MTQGRTRGVVRWLPFGMLVVAAGLLAFRYGWIDANLTELEAIAAYADRYERDSGSDIRDCVGIPGKTVWLVVRCGPRGAHWEYRVNRFGGLVGVARPGETIDMEQRI